MTEDHGTEGEHDHRGDGEHDHSEGHDHDETHDHGSDEAGRVTSPMQEFTGGEAGTGALVAAAGLLVAYAVPVAL